MSSDADKICDHLSECRGHRILRYRIGNLPYSCQRVETALLLASAEYNETYVITKDLSWPLNDYHLDFLTQNSKPGRGEFRNYPGNRNVIFVTLCISADAFLMSVMRVTHNYIQQQLSYCIASIVRHRGHSETRIFRAFMSNSRTSSSVVCAKSR